MPSALTPRAAFLTALAMTAFAANSLLCRAALREGSIDPATFSTVRLVSGALVLGWLARGREASGGRLAALFLFAYAVPFSFAYTALDAGTGALILFGAVQTTMLVVGLVQGERPHVLQTLGLLLAVGGLVYLLLPGADAPNPRGFLLMATAGIGWGAYSLCGRGARDPLAATAGNFARSVPWVLVVSAVTWRDAHFEAEGLGLAVASGALASGLGYTIWYAALPALGAVRAASVQLSVPVITAAAGVALLGESITVRLVIASLLVLGGIGLTLRPKASRG